MRVTLIHNPSAGDNGHDAEQLQRLVRAAGHEVLYQSCKDAQWEQALDKPADLVAVAGGDGTVARLAKRLAGKGVPLAVLPAGTANNVARTLKVFGVPLEKLIASWNGAPRVRFDLGTARGPWGSSLFAEGVGVGLFAWTLLQSKKAPPMADCTVSEAKVAHGVHLLRERLRHFPAQQVRAQLDGRDVSGEYLLVEAMNTQYVGPNLFLAPKAEQGDGCMDVVMVSEAEREPFEAYLASWQKGWLRPPDFTTHRGRELRMEWSGFELHIDDEHWPGADEQPPSPGGSIELDAGGECVEFLMSPEEG